MKSESPRTLQKNQDEYSHKDNAMIGNIAVTGVNSISYARHLILLLIGRSFHGIGITKRTTRV